MIDDIRSLLEADPFRPFSIETSSNACLEVNSPKQVTIPFHGETIHYHTRDWELHIIAVRHIIRLTVREGRR